MRMSILLVSAKSAGVIVQSAGASTIPSMHIDTTKAIDSHTTISGISTLVVVAVVAVSIVMMMMMVMSPWRVVRGLTSGTRACGGEIKRGVRVQHLAGGAVLLGCKGQDV